MDIKTCKLLAQYNQTTNQKLSDIFRSLSHDRWIQEFDGYFKSIKQLCSHIYVSDHTWLKRFGQLRDFLFIQDALFDQNLVYGSNPFDDIGGYTPKREELDKKIIMFVEELVEGDLEKILSFKNTKGELVKRNLGGSILHLFNHQTHHRGMISVYLDSMQIPNDYSSLLQLV